MSSKTVSTSASFVKSLSTGATLFLIDQFMVNDSNFNISAYLAPSSTDGAYLGVMVGSSIPDLSHSLPVVLGNGKGLFKRVAEIGFGAGTA